MRDNNAEEHDILSSFWDHLGKSHVTDKDMRIAIRAVVIKLGLEKNRILPGRVRSHSFRTGEGNGAEIYRDR